MKRIIYFLAVLMFANITVYAQSKSEKQVAAAVEFLKKAMIDGSRESLEAIAGDKLSYGHSGGKVENKAEFVEAIASGNSDFVSIDLSDQTIQISGKTAIVRHTLVAKTNDRGVPGNVKLHILTVWQKSHGKWVMIARQAVKKP
ncbi:nuclear transport factor 2 family protein [Arcticibacter sp.]|uniref:nuclear transport factor 2 family protein n=1 Tax=Arcticibacter sp. TaxID=1872630 RepID=UPI00388D8F94